MVVLIASFVRRACGHLFAIQARHFSTNSELSDAELFWRLSAGKRSPRIKLAILLKERKFREKHEKILLEGWRLIKDALLAKAEAVNIFFSDKKLLERLPLTTDEKLLIPVDSNVMKRLSSTVTPPGIVGVFRRPQQGGSDRTYVESQYQRQRLPLTVICDGVKDPSNLGTLIRASAAAGCRCLITTKGSMDVWDPKVLRCAAGGHFHLPMFYSLTWESIFNHFGKNTRIFMADSNVETMEGDTSKAHYEVDWTLSSSALIIGGETTGLSNEALGLIREQSGQPIRIPMTGGVDSLSAGVAASIIVYEAYRQTHQDETNKA